MGLIDLDKRSGGCSYECQHDRTNCSCKQGAGRGSGPTIVVGDYNEEFELTEDRTKLSLKLAFRVSFEIRAANAPRTSFRYTVHCDDVECTYPRTLILDALM
jgi:hypothetical protein